MRILGSVLTISIVSILLFNTTSLLSVVTSKTQRTVVVRHTQGLIKRPSSTTRANSPASPWPATGLVNMITSWGDDTANRVTLDTSNINTISTGEAHHLAINYDATVIGWGNNTKGQLNIPDQIKNGQVDVMALSAGSLHSVALIDYYADDGLKYSVATVWGDNSKGQRLVPSKITNNRATPLAIAAGTHHTVAVSTEYDPISGTEIVTIESWGNNSTASVPNALRPIDPLHDGVQQLVVSGNHNAVLFGDGGIYEWHITGQAVAHLADATTRYTKIAVGDAHLLAITQNNTLVGWGDNSKGQLAIPTAVSCWSDVVSGSNHVVGIDCNDNIYAWGDNSKGQTTIPTLATDHSATRLQLSAYGNHTLLLYQMQPTYTLTRWGAKPDDLPAIRTDIEYISAGINHAMAIISDSTVIAWGDNSAGQSTVPTTLTNAYSLATGMYHSMALDDAGTIWGWGSNKSGQLNIPTGLDQIIDIAAGRDFSIAHAMTQTDETDSGGNPILTNTVTIWGGNAKKTLPTNDLKQYLRQLKVA